MEVVQNRIARFSELIERCGRPEVHSLRTIAGNLAELNSIRRGHRALTVILDDLADATFAVVGMFERTRSVVLVFPKSLKEFVDARIVAVRWDLIND